MKAGPTPLETAGERNRRTLRAEAIAAREANWASEVVTFDDLLDHSIRDSADAADPLLELLELAVPFWVVRWARLGGA